MKNFTKCLALVLLTVFSSLGAYAFDFYDTVVTPDGIIGYTQTGESTVMLTYCVRDYNGGIEIPETVTFYDKTYTVTEITEYAFYGCTGLTSVTIPNSVTSIGNVAFRGCTGLTSVTIPGSVTSIGRFAFFECENITKLNITDLAAWFEIEFESEMSNPLYCSNGCALYLNDSKITHLTVPNSVTQIKDYLFAYCSSLTSVTIPTSVTSIGDYVFSGCTGLTSVTIPNSMTTIGRAVFSGCSVLSSVSIPNTITEIDEYAFANCDELKSVVIPRTLTKLCANSFPSTTLLLYEDGSPAASEGVVYNDDKTKLLCVVDQSVESVTIPNTVTEIGDGAFSGCTNLTSVTIPNTVTELGESTFQGCTGLTSATISNSVSTIGSNVFAYCSALSSVTIPNSVTEIGEIAFYGCSSLGSVNIPNSVTTIGSAAFYGCSSLSEIYSPATQPAVISDDTFGKDTYTTATLFVSKGYADTYTNANGWKKFQNIREMNFDSGADEIAVEEAKVVGYYNLQGVLSTEPWHGLNIVVYSDGSTRKVMCR